MVRRMTSDIAHGSPHHSSRQTRTIDRRLSACCLNSCDADHKKSTWKRRNEAPPRSLPSVSSDGYAQTVERAADLLNGAGIDVNRAVIFPDATPKLSKNGSLGLSRR